MSGYTRANFDEIEPAGSDERFEFRFSRELIEARDVGVTRVRLTPDTRLPLVHRHREQEEAYVVVSGTGRALLDGDVIVLRQWDVVRVAPEVARAFEAGPDGLELIAVGGPKPEGGDGERAELEWPD
jgi:quercetin dioxygenase-like cupin family protein